MFRSLEIGKHALGILAVCGLIAWFSNAGGIRYNVKQISAPDAKALVDSGAVVVDVRGREAFHSGHIPGAISVPLHDLESGIPAALAGAKTKSMVVYCGDGVTTGPAGTEILNKAGYPNAVNLKSGLGGWQKAGYPLAQGNG